MRVGLPTVLAVICALSITAFADTFVYDVEPVLDAPGPFGEHLNGVLSGSIEWDVGLAEPPQLSNAAFFSFTYTPDPSLLAGGPTTWTNSELDDPDEVLFLEPLGSPTLTRVFGTTFVLSGEGGAFAGGYLQLEDCWEVINDASGIADNCQEAPGPNTCWRLLLRQGSSVPEPSSLVLLIAGGALLAWRQRRRGTPTSP